MTSPAPRRGTHEDVADVADVGVADMATLGAARAAGTARLAAAGVEDARRDAGLLLAAAAEVEPGTERAWPERPLTAEAQTRYDGYLRRREAREPVARILGRREFWSLSFELSEATLDPRADSETLVEALLERIGRRDRALRLLDLGTGSGCLLLALLAELPRAWGVGLDRSEAAAATARRNAEALGLAARSAFVVGDWAGALVSAGDGGGAGFDLIVSNPPYITRHELAGLAPEVGRYDPPAALDGGVDGLDAYRALAAALPVLLRPGGWAAVEIGAGQADSASAALVAGGLPSPVLLRDLAEHPRGLLFQAPAPAPAPAPAHAPIADKPL